MSPELLMSAELVCVYTRGRFREVVLEWKQTDHMTDRSQTQTLVSAPLPPPPSCLLPNYCNCQSRQRMLSRKKSLSSLWSATKMASQTSGLRFTFSRLYNRVSKKMSAFFPPPWSLVGLYSLIGESWRRAVFQHKLSIAAKQKRGFLQALTVLSGSRRGSTTPFLSMQA